MPFFHSVHAFLWRKSLMRCSRGEPVSPFKHGFSIFLCTGPTECRVSSGKNALEGVALIQEKNHVWCKLWNQPGPDQQAFAFYLCFNCSGRSWESLRNRFLRTTSKNLSLILDKKRYQRVLRRINGMYLSGMSQGTKVRKKSVKKSWSVKSGKVRGNGFKVSENSYFFLSIFKTSL